MTKEKIMNGIILVCLLSLGFLLGMPSTALAFKVPIHEQITREVFADFQVVAGGQTLKFTDYAINQIVNANKHTDDLPNQANSEMHFDGEDFAGGSKRVMDLKEKVISKVTTEEPESTSARNDLGTALHTIQDFYAHSNWVELGHSSPNINRKIGTEIFSGADKNTPTCPTDPGTLGGAGLSQLTSGYFILSNQLACGVPQGKCRHGVPVVCPDGLNKDDDSRPGFLTARPLAVDATKDYLNQIFSDSRITGNINVIKLLMRINN
ncbi:HET-C-related protein [Tolypothrix sp. VBCCA 56010]|uniref:HET-C-related protein n=1 Tax=Tolypothrix sp. VBCCA 56010 TaxID=3137731 RepID=UPI003D7E2BF5